MKSASRSGRSRSSDGGAGDTAAAEGKQTEKYVKAALVEFMMEFMRKWETEKAKNRVWPAEFIEYRITTLRLAGVGEAWKTNAPVRTRCKLMTVAWC